AEFRLRNTSSGSYTSENTRSHDAEVTPYGRVLYPFTAKLPTELSLSEFELVTLIQHVDQDWTEGEISCKRGLFPTSFIEIIVDCPYSYRKDLSALSPVSPCLKGDEHMRDINTLSSSQHGAGQRHDKAVLGRAAYQQEKADEENGNILHTDCLQNKTSFCQTCHDKNRLPVPEVQEVTDDPSGTPESHEIGLVIHSFLGEVSQDATVEEGETIEVLRHVNENWLEIQTDSGQRGMVPKNHVEIIGPWPKKETVLSEQTRAARETKTNSILSVPTTKKVLDNSSPKDIVQNSVALHEVDFQPSNRHEAIVKSNKSVVEELTENIVKRHPSPQPLKPLISPKPKPPLPSKPAIAPKPVFVYKKPSPTIIDKTEPFKPSNISSLASNNTQISVDDLKENSQTQFNVSNSSAVLNSSMADSQLQGKLTKPDSNAQRLTPSDATVQASSFSDGPDPRQNVIIRNRPRSLVSAANSKSFSETAGQTVSPNNRRPASMAVQDRPKSSEFVLTSDQTSFVNKAFQMDTDEGNLIDLKVSRPSPPRRPPPRLVPPVNADVTRTSPPTLVFPHKPPPPRPTGPRIAPAPPKTVLVPLKVDIRPKLVPKRPAPRAPSLAANSVSQSQRQGSVAIDGGPPIHPPRRHPPRPASFPAVLLQPQTTDLMVFSPGTSNSGGAQTEPSPELVADIKSKLKENQSDIKKYEDSQRELRESIERAESQEEQAELRDNLDFVGNTLAGLREEERGLKENLFLLVPHEARLEKARLLTAQRAEAEEQRLEEERKRAIEVTERKREQRGKVIEEMLETEKDYLFSLQLCLETFLEGPKPPAGIDLEFLLGNTEEIADVSQKLYANLESSVYGKSFENQIIGKCFTFFAEDMKNTYAPYCRNHDEVITAMERYAENAEVSEYLKQRLERMREHMNVFDIAGVLIKPVQRILKYPLLLNELLKNTEDDHPDKYETEMAIKAITDVAKAINEYKRRKDLVYKYKKFSDQTFSDKISKLNLHSIKKKSSRIRGRLSTNFGIALQMRDETFEREEAKFRNLEKAVKIFLRSILQFLDQSKDAMTCQETVAAGIEEFYAGKENVEARKLLEVVAKVAELFQSMKSSIESTVVIPLNTLVALFNAPSHVIEKRFDKLLDYNHQLGKAENDKELLAAKNDYEAMNAQLLDELPKFYNQAFTLLRHCISAFVLARRDFMDQSLKESCVLLELPFMASRSNIMETFNIRYTTAFDHMSLLNFIPRGFNPRVDTIKADKAKLKGKLTVESVITHQPYQTTNPGSQSDSQRSYLHQKYSTDKLYTVTSTYNASDIMDISLTEGAVVGVVKELDPMGNKERWFVDDGANKGFAPSNILTPYKASPCNSLNSYPVDDDLISLSSFDSGEAIVISGNDGRVSYHAGGSGVE
ncbi:unnamed protein product, partial [Lymnaea stagnalis]